MENKDKKYNFVGTGLTEEQKSWGSLRFDEYISSYPHLNTLGNSQLLEELVWVEAVLEANKEAIGVIVNKKISKDSPVSKTKDIVPSGLLTAVEEGRAEVINIKTKLGMFEERKDSDEFKKMRELEEKAAEYRLSHPLSFKTTCVHCGKSYGLKRRTENFEEFKSPFLDDKLIKNDSLWESYKDQQPLTKERVAEILGVSPLYIDWLAENIYHSGIKKDKVEE